MLERVLLLYLVARLVLLFLALWVCSIREQRWCRRYFKEHEGEGVSGCMRWTCSCGLEHRGPHVKNLFTLKRQALWCPHCGQMYGGPEVFNLLDVMRCRPWWKVMGSLPGIFLREVIKGVVMILRNLYVSLILTGIVLLITVQMVLDRLPCQ